MIQSCNEKGNCFNTLGQDYKELLSHKVMIISTELSCLVHNISTNENCVEIFIQNFVKSIHAMTIFGCVHYLINGTEGQINKINTECLILYFNPFPNNQC